MHWLQAHSCLVRWRPHWSAAAGPGGVRDTPNSQRACCPSILLGWRRPGSGAAAVARGRKAGRGP